MVLDDTVSSSTVHTYACTYGAFEHQAEHRWTHVIQSPIQPSRLQFALSCVSSSDFRRRAAVVRRETRSHKNEVLFAPIYYCRGAGNIALRLRFLVQ